MTTVQASIINKMIKNSNDTHRYYNAYDELVRTCSDAPQQPTVTVSATGTATPPPPSTPTPLGPQWWKERQAEALREQIQIIADQNKTIEALKKQIAEDGWHSTIKSGIDKACREQANELVLANKEIIEALNHWGLRSNTGSLVSNVTDVIKQCAAQEKKIEEFRKVVRDRNEEIEKLKGRIEVMDRMAKASRQFDETDRDLIKKKDDEIESLQKRIVIRDGFHYRDREIMSELRKQISDLSKQIEVRQGFTQQDREIIAARNAEIADLRKQVSTLTKQVSQRDMTISVLNKEIDQKEVVINVITGQREVAHKNITEINKHLSEEMRETEDLKKQLMTAVNKLGSAVKSGNNLRDNLRGILRNNVLPSGENLMGQHAIQLWEDATK